MTFKTGSFVARTYPNGIVTVAGEKKKIPANRQFSRPWQARMPAPNPEKCPFHKQAERDAALLVEVDESGERWFVMDSAFAPEDPHRLVIPDTCWEEEQMRTLGGFEKIRTGVSLAVAQFANETPENQKGVWGFSIQVGPLAAQNVPHAHYHLYKPNLMEVVRGEIKKIENPEPVVNTFRHWPVTDSFREHSLVFEESGFSVNAGGQFTGMLFILPVDVPKFDDEAVDQLARLVDRVVSLVVRKFRSVEGMGPDYKFEFEIYRGMVMGGIFVPKLNNTGTLEDMAMLDPRRGWNLLWPHEETAAYLREE